MCGRAVAALLLLAAAGPPVAAQTRLLLVVHGSQSGDRFVPELTEACADAFGREGFVALPLQAQPGRPQADQPPESLPPAEARRLGASFVVEVEVAGTSDLVVQATLTAVADGALLASVTVTGAAELGMRRKAAHIAQEIAPHIRKRLAADTLAAASAAALAPAAPAPAEAAITAAPAAAPPQVAAPSAQAAAQPAASALPSAQPGPSAQESAGAAAEARTRLQRDLARARERRRRGTVRAAVAWGAGALAVAGAVLAWRLSDESYNDYADESGDGVPDKARLFGGIAIGAGTLGGAAAVTGLVFWLRRPDTARLERALAEAGGPQPERP